MNLPDRRGIRGTDLHTDVQSGTKAYSGVKIVLASVFILSGLSKILLPNATTQAVFVYLPLSPYFWLTVAILASSILEILVGLGLLFHRPRLGPLGLPIVAYCLLSVFLGIGIGRAWQFESANCGCFGALSLTDSTLLALVRDSVFFFMAFALVIWNGGRTRVYRTIALGSVLVFLGILIFSESNRRRINLDPVEAMTSSQDPMLYGYPTSELRDASAIQISEAALGVSVLIEPDPTLSHFSRLESSSGAILGWIAFRALPVPGYPRAHFRIAVVYGPHAKVQHLRIESPSVYLGPLWPDSESVAALSAAIVRNRKAGFIQEGSPGLSSDTHGGFFHRVVSSINSLTMALLLARSVEEIAGW